MVARDIEFNRPRETRQHLKIKLILLLSVESPPEQRRFTSYLFVGARLTLVFNMGGGHDHGHHQHYKIPDYKIYKVEDVPELMAVRRALAADGLKDPWLRNEVWKYTIKGRGTSAQTFKKVVGRGFLIGLVAGAITAVCEKVWMAKKYPHHHDHHGAEEGHAHH